MKFQCCLVDVHQRINNWITEEGSGSVVSCKLMSLHMIYRHLWLWLLLLLSLVVEKFIVPSSLGWNSRRNLHRRNWRWSSDVKILELRCPAIIHMSIVRNLNLCWCSRVFWMSWVWQRSTMVGFKCGEFRIQNSILRVL